MTPALIQSLLSTDIIQCFSSPVSGTALELWTKIFWKTWRFSPFSISGFWLCGYFLVSPPLSRQRYWARNSLSVNTQGERGKFLKILRKEGRRGESEGRKGAGEWGGKEGRKKRMKKGGRKERERTEKNAKKSILLGTNFQKVLICEQASWILVNKDGSWFHTITISKVFVFCDS